MTSLDISDIISTIYTKDKEEDLGKELCMICGDILHNGNDRIHKLKCNHEFHLDCIYNSYKFSFSTKKRECPYCRKEGGYLPLKTEDMVPLKNINKEYKQKITNSCSILKKKYVVKEICKGITKCGQNCKNKAFPNAVSISNHSISLPVGPHINKETIENIYNNLIKIIRKLK